MHATQHSTAQHSTAQHSTAQLDMVMRHVQYSMQVVTQAVNAYAAVPICKHTTLSILTSNCLLGICAAATMFCCLIV
jgi:hypothetical protein